MIDHYTPISEEEAAWLAQYHAGEIENYPKPSMTADIILFTIEGGVLKVLLIERRDHPFKGRWAIPGGYLDVGNGVTEQGEHLISCAYRELEEETGLTPNLANLVNMGIFDTPYRDPRGRVITNAFYALVSPDCIGVTRAGDDAAKAAWVTVKEAKQWDLAFDHNEILDEAVSMLRNRVRASVTALLELLPTEFTAAQIRDAYNAVMVKPLSRQTIHSRLKKLVERKIFKVVRGEGRTKVYCVRPDIGTAGLAYAVAVQG